MYEVGLAHKFAYNKKIAHDHLRTKQWARWARVTLPILLDDQAPTVWHPSDPCFAMLTLDEVGTGNHEEFMDAWGSSILNDVLVSLVVDACSAEETSCDALRDALQACTAERRLHW